MNELLREKLEQEILEDNMARRVINTKLTNGQINKHIYKSIEILFGEEDEHLLTWVREQANKAAQPKGKFVRQLIKAAKENANK